MSKIQSIYVCSTCDAQSLKWSGRCLECGGWGTLKAETREAREEKEIKVAPAAAIDFDKLEGISAERVKTGIGEVDRVLGGGIVQGSLILLSGEPGIGKSTIVAQIADAAGGQSPVLYASGEESAGQVKERLIRLGCKIEKTCPVRNMERTSNPLRKSSRTTNSVAEQQNAISNGIKFINETNAEKIIATAAELKPILVVVDSIQTVYSSAVDSEAGSVTQIRAAAAKFLELAKQKNIAVILVGHVTKDGQAAGPKTLEHIVDTVIYLETENVHNYRVLRATKNRFGSVNELGIFEMTAAGFKEIKNPSAVFLEEARENLSGSVISSVMEGSRPFLVEIQALVTKTVFGYPVRKASGFDLNRLQVLAAVLTKRAKINLTNQDIILNVVGGLRIDDPALDLAVAAAIISSLLNQTIDRKTIILGEVGLGGEVRNVSRLEERLAEAEKLGFTRAIIPPAEVKTKKIKLEKVKNLGELIAKIT